MARTLVESSALASVGYNQAQQVLEVEFTNGGLYHYLDVAAREYQGLLGAESHGSYFNEHIKDHYRFIVIRKPR